MSRMRIYVGNLPYNASEDEVRQLFAHHGTVHSVRMITDRETGRPRGFAFVEMDAGAATDAIQALDGEQFNGRTLRVNQAKERERSGGGGGRGQAAGRGGAGGERGGPRGGGSRGPRAGERRGGPRRGGEEAGEGGGRRPEPGPRY